MIISLGTDHAGYGLKEHLKSYLAAQGLEILDCGADSPESSDYPDYVIPAAEAVASGRADLGIVFGGSGNGEAIAANKVKGIRCALCWNVDSAHLARQHNNANVIALGGRFIAPELGEQIVDAWLAATFEGGRHERRIGKIADYENR